ncbi:GerAB/ArcD/ProY family transporter [Aneurinibacillus sp. Ricciae_BoGa-3]|uniref:GerAB/ArcD/ProY family transporter n=1 Tax=Aneurinibacillus sp. Ricciae_BoGa-3 TaxID=3022697 RepID=UPI00234202F0|nr:GerAB/ArcD/ProY family transporter [Aneurinibacillus sp. Ricciae_BoGa-3]WCK56535.1 GerAB/ArcD/ProY family transporter [Aneurinibacillus sp. Ricciae_BoGa-3]
MNRYWFYLILENMLVNVIIFIPYALIEQRFDGMMQSILWGIPIGVFFIYLFMKSLSKFPGKDLPQIMREASPRWFALPFILLHGVMIYLAGAITMVAFCNITITFINPDIPLPLLLLVFSIVASVIIQLPSEKILYFIEIVIVIYVPWHIFILFKAFISPQMRWDAIVESLTHITNPPNWSGVAASSYIFSGYANMAIFNRLFKTTFRFRWAIIYGLMGILTLFGSVFIPIGLEGTGGVGDFTFPAVVAADSLRVQYGFVERLIFLFLFLYAHISFMSMVIHWHVSMEIFKRSLPKNVKQGKKNVAARWVASALFIGGVLILGSFNEEQFFRFSERWISVRLATEAMLVLTIVWAARRKKHAG